MYASEIERKKYGNRPIYGSNEYQKERMNEWMNECLGKKIAEYKKASRL